MCAPQGQWVTDSALVCGPLQCKLQGQAVEGGAGDLSLRIELIPLVSHRLLLPLPSPHSAFEGEDHFSQHASLLGDCVL